MPTPFLIREAKSDDADVLADFNTRMAWETEQVALEPAVIAAGVHGALADSTKAQYFVAESEGRVVGQLMLTYEWSDWRNGNIWWIQSVYVHTNFRRRGIFRALYEHVRKESGLAGAVGLRLYVEHHNATAQATYQQLGMKNSGYLVMEEIFPR